MLYSLPPYIKAPMLVHLVNQGLNEIQLDSWEGQAVLGSFQELVSIHHNWGCLVKEHAS